MTRRKYLQPITSKVETKMKNKNKINKIFTRRVKKINRNSRANLKALSTLKRIVEESPHEASRDIRIWKTKSIPQLKLIADTLSQELAQQNAQTDYDELNLAQTVLKLKRLRPNFDFNVFLTRSRKSNSIGKGIGKSKSNSPASTSTVSRSFSPMAPELAAAPSFHKKEEKIIQKIIAEDGDEPLDDLTKWQFLPLPELYDLLEDFNSEDAQYSYDHAKFIKAVIDLKQVNSKYDFSVFL